MKNVRILESEKLIVGYDGKALIEDIDFQIERGMVTTLIGPNGCGKSTILKTIIGQLSEIGGVIYLEGENMKKIKASQIAETMSIVMTERINPELMTCRDVVATGRYPYTGRFGILSKEDNEKVFAALENVDATDIAEQAFDNISDGQRQRIMLARAMCQEPKVLVLDEPTSYLDIKYKLDILLRIRQMARQRNVAVIMSLHELELVDKISDRVIAIGDNEIKKIGTVDEVLEPEFIKKLYKIGDEEYSLLTSSANWWEKSASKKNADCDGVKKEIDSKQETGNEKNNRPACIMVQGTMSSAGKSLLVAGLCRVFTQDGYRVVPFKSQNMALNSYITEDGLEMGRAQVMQAEAAGITPNVYMNPILLKPTSDVGSQVIVNGKVLGNMKAMEYFEYKKNLIPQIIEAYDKVSKNADIVVIEGAGSPAEINLKENDIVNMGMAKLVNAPVLLVGDIDRGGVFAQLLGTLELLDDDEKKRVKGLIVNKFRGDKKILDPGVEILEKRSGIAVPGVIPFMDIQLEDEDSVTDRFNDNTPKLIDIAVIKLPHIANFTDFAVFDEIEDVSVRYVRNEKEIGEADLIIIPGSKNTIGDMKWLTENEIDKAIIDFAAKGKPVIGICGGYQMLGKIISDPDSVEEGGSIAGMGLLNVNTVLRDKKHRSQVTGKFENPEGIFAGLAGLAYEGYEIHMGDTVLEEAEDVKEKTHYFTSVRSGYCQKNVYGTYVHGVFDKAEVVKVILKGLADRRNVTINLEQVVDYGRHKEKEYDRLADALREHMDMEYIYKIMGIK